MKFQYLAVIFIIIMLPISMVLSVYVQNQVETIDMQISYDSKLANATYDAIKAFQINTINSSTSDITNSKLRDIEAAANSFYTSLESNFSTYGYNTEDLKNFVPALVFTMYDGFYIYSTYENVLDDVQVESNSAYQGGDEITELKPYITYSCRYINTDASTPVTDVVITYSLDNYITIDGYIYNKYVHDAGYLINDVELIDNRVYYRGVEITEESKIINGQRVGLTEYVGGTEYEYIKVNGVKYYYDNNQQQWFTLMNGERNYGAQSLHRGTGNNMAKLFYQEAAEFKNRIITDYCQGPGGGLGGLTPANAVDENGAPLSTLTDENNDVVYDFSSTEAIFNFNDNGTSIEDPDSNFNQHRRAVMRYVIEKNLSVALNNYSNITTGTYEFKMPRLSEQDWDRILNNVSLISFLQGLSIGGKIYNGYSVVNNNKNEEVVTEDSIYILTNDGVYHRVNEKDLASNIDGNTIGVFNIDFERKSIYDNDVQTTVNYFPKPAIGSYTSIVTQTNVESTDNLLEYVEGVSGNLAKIYYTALGRERYSMYKVFRNPSEHLAQF